MPDPSGITRTLLLMTALRAGVLYIKVNGALKRRFVLLYLAWKVCQMPFDAPHRGSNG